MKDIFAKCYVRSKADEVKDLGIYPYFHALESKQDTEVIMEGKRRIMLGSNNYLEPLSEQPSRKLYTDGVGLLRGNLTRLKGLDNVIALYAAGLVVTPLGAFHILCGIFDAHAV